MKRTILSLCFLMFLTLSLNAQETENPRFNLKNNVVTSVLQLETAPVSEMHLNIQIYTAGVKDANVSRVSQQITALRGKATHSIDVSDLPSGTYFIEISQEKKGRIYRKQFTKE